MIDVDINEVMQILPHRPPFLMIDRVINIDIEKKTGIGIKNVTINEPFFVGHFPVRPVMPGVLLIEAMAQVACVVAAKCGIDSAGGVVYLLSVDKVKFRKPVVPGDQLRLLVEPVQGRGSVWIYKARTEVDGLCVAESVITAMGNADDSSNYHH